MYQLLFPAADTTGRQGRGHGVIDRLLDREKRDIRLIYFCPLSQTINGFNRYAAISR